MQVQPALYSISAEPSLLPVACYTNVRLQIDFISFGLQCRRVVWHVACVAIVDCCISSVSFLVVAVVLAVPKHLFMPRNCYTLPQYRMTRVASRESRLRVSVALPVSQSLPPSNDKICRIAAKRTRN